jgi:4-hydroxybutyrate dehydrogenase
MGGGRNQTVALIQYLSRIQFDFGACRLLGDELAVLGVTRPLVVSDPGVVASGVLERALAHLEPGRVAATFDRVPANPTWHGVQAALMLYREHGCDGIVAVGGGSAIDTAKAVALLATHDGVLADYRVEDGGSARITARIAPLVAVPTTAGTGSEIGRGMGIGIDDGPKATFISLHLIPKVAICDPELTFSLPAPLTAGTGMDAFSHCLEGFLSPAINPPADAVALDGIARLTRFLPRAVADGNDREARWNVLMGALEGGMSMWKGLGPAHALSLPLDALDLHHGTLVGVLLPLSVDFVAGAVGHQRLERLADALGCPDAGAIPAHLTRFNAVLGLPADLAAMRVTNDILPWVAAEAAASFFNQSSARRGSAGEYLSLAQRALHAAGSTLAPSPEEII